MLTAARSVAIVVLALAVLLSLVQGAAVVSTRRTSHVAYGIRRLRPGAALVWLIASLTAAVFAGTMVALRHVLMAGVVMGAAGIAGTALSSCGLARGGAAGPAPAVLWWRDGHGRAIDRGQVLGEPVVGLTASADALEQFLVVTPQAYGRVWRDAGSHTRMSGKVRRCRPAGPLRSQSGPRTESMSELGIGECDAKRSSAAVPGRHGG